MMLDYQSLKTNIFNLVNVDAQKVLDSIQDEEYCDPVNPRKRKRLDDFTPQERLIRRKLKNRAAAQNARDRKKERMDYLEKVVSQLEVENKELKRSNEELRTNMNILMEQNKELLLHLGKRSPQQENDKTIEPEVVNMCTDHTYSTKPVDTDTSDQNMVILEDDHFVIKKEKETEAKQASLGISLPQKLQILLVSLITMWLTNPRLTNYLTSMSKSNQEEVLKKMILQKLSPKLKQESSKTYKTVEALLRTNVMPMLEHYAKKRQMNYSNSAKKCKIWLEKQSRIS